MSSVVIEDEFVGVCEAIRKTGWGSGRLHRLALLGEIDHRVRPGGLIQFSLRDIESVVERSK